MSGHCVDAASRYIKVPNQHNDPCHSGMKASGIGYYANGVLANVTILCRSISVGDQLEQSHHEVIKKGGPSLLKCSMNKHQANIE